MTPEPSQEWDVISIGEIMVERLFPSEIPASNTTKVLPTHPRGLGGSALNLAWYLSGFGHRSRLVSPLNREDEPLLDARFAGRGLDREGLIPIDAKTDELITFVTKVDHRSLYLLADLPDDFAVKVEQRLEGCRMLVLNSGRHPQMRRFFASLDRETLPSKTLVFNPSYAIYEYQASELESILRQVDILALNEEELEYARNILARTDAVGELQRRGGVVIVSRGRKGVRVHHPGGSLELPSRADRPGVFIGAGDALLAGYLHGALQGKALEEAVGSGLELAAAVVRSGDVRVEAEL